MSVPDISQLTPPQQEALQTYTAVTDQDPVAAIPLLQRAEWNVQIAIARFFDGEPTHDPVAEAQASLPNTSTRQTSNLQYESLLAATRSSRPTRSVEDTVERIDTRAVGEQLHAPPFLLSTLLTPIRILYRIFNAFFSPLSFLIPTFVTRIFNRFLTQRSRPTRRSLPPADNARRFIREFSEEYGENTLPFIESGFNLTLDSTKRDLKFLLVILLSPNHDDNLTWVQDTLLSSSFKSFLDSHKHEVVLWGGNVQDTEGYQVSSSLQCTKFPFAALICNTTDASSSGMTVVMRAVGSMPASELVAKLGAAMTTHQAQLRAARAQQAEQQASRNLRQEQDSAYERSLAQDRERARRKREEQEIQAQAEKEAQAQAQAEEMQQRKSEQWKRWRAQSLSDEPGPEVKDTVRLSIRMLSGDRIIRRFKPDTELEDLYAFIECYEVMQSQDHTSSSIGKPADYKHEYNFRLVSPMPRMVFDLEKGGYIRDRIGRGGNLIVEPNIAEEDGSENE